MQTMKWSAIKWVTGLLSLYLDARLRKPRKHRPIDIIVIDIIMGWSLAKPYVKNISAHNEGAYDTAIKQVYYWHGTGRLQYQKDGSVVDILQKILQQDGLKPFNDVFDVKHGGMVSISLARQRMYARIYADMHAYKGVKLTERYGSPRFWAYYFIMAINLHAIKELGLWSRKSRHEQEAVWRAQGKKLWTVKVTKKDGESVGLFFNLGSDIQGNYPILIGLKKAHYDILETSSYVARYECRVGSVIPISYITHIEAPYSKLHEVNALLDTFGYGSIPVFAIEQCELFCSIKNFSTLVR